MGLFEDILEGFFKIIEAITNAIRRVFLIVADIITWFGQEILPKIALVFSALVIAVAVLAIFAPAVATAIVDFFAFGTYTLGTYNLGLLNIGPISIDLSMSVLRTILATFLEMIHFDTLVALHNIAWVLSEDYRKVLSKVFKKMSEISEELFGWSLGLRVILENTRSIVLSSSAALGYSYDVNQLIWLNSLTDFTILFNEHAETYMEDPEQLFFDLEDWIEEHAIDISGGAHALIYQSVVKLTDGVHGNALELKNVQSRSRENQFQLNRLTAGNFGQRIDWNWKAFEGFKGDEYAPRQGQQEKNINANRQETAANRKTLSDLNFKLTRPTGQLEGIDKLSEPEKTDEEINLEDLSTRPFQDDSAVLAADQAAADADREKEAAELEAEQLKPAAVETIVTKPVTKAEFKPRPPVNSWFVGEY